MFDFKFTDAKIEKWPSQNKQDYCLPVMRLKMMILNF